MKNSIMIHLLLLLLAITTGCAQNTKDMSIQSKSLQNNDPGQYPVEKSDSQWKEQLSAEEYKVLRKAGTESPFTGKYYKNNQSGIYFSAASGQPLFVSDAKYDSGCGWPSFFEPILPGAIFYRTDRSHGMERTEIIDSGSGSHLGHVFNDGPAPTGLRYCLNSAAMVFVEAGKPWPPVVQQYMDQHASEEEIQAVQDFIDSSLPSE